MYIFPGLSSLPSEGGNHNWISDTNGSRTSVISVEANLYFPENAERTTDQADSADDFFFKIQRKIT
jgi:hypothetical protein